MAKRFNLLVLTVLLLSQTILTPLISVHTVFAESVEDENQAIEQVSETEQDVVDIAEFKDYLKELKQYKATDYTEDSFMYLLEAIKEGEELVEQVDVKEKDIKKVTDVLEMAEKNLKQVEEKDLDHLKDEGEENSSSKNANEGEEILENDQELAEKSEKEVDKVITVDYEKAKRAIEKAQKSKSNEDVKTALKLIEAVENEEQKKELEKLIEDIHVHRAVEQSNAFFDLTISEITDLQGKVYDEENPLKPDDEFWLKTNWLLKDGHSYKAGDTVTFNLPKELVIEFEFEDELIDELENVFATYVVSKDGKVTLTFTELVEQNSDIKGWMEIRAELDKNQVTEEDGKVVIGPINDEGTQSLPIDRSPKDKTVDKQGKTNKSYNADEIEWSVTFNKTATSFKDVVLEDLMPSGTVYKEGSLKVIKQNATLNGTPVGEPTEVSITPSVADGKLSIPLGDIDEVYTLTYTTKVTDMEVKNFKNTVTFKDADLDDTSANATVTINRGEPLKKGVVKDYNPKTGIIEWYVEFNYDQKSLEDVTLADHWKPEGKIELVDGSLTFQEVEIDEDGNGKPVGEPIDPSALGNLSKVDDGFEVSGITTDKPYYVVYQTKVKDRELEGFRMENTVSFDGNEYGEGSDIGQYVGAKHAGDIDYAKKEIEWKILVNSDEHQMNDVVIEDTLGDGLTLLEDSIKMTIDGQEKTDFDLESGNPFKLTNIGDTDKEIIVTYKTKYDPNALPENYQANNTADISWIPEGSSDRISREVKANKPVNKETVDGSWKNASYNPDTKEITWEIIANYRENTYENFHIVDTPQGNQQLVEDSIKVEELKIDSDGSWNVVRDANANVTTDGNNIHIQIGETDKAYKVTYTTSIAGLEDISKEYVNEAQVKDSDEVLAELEEKVSVYGDRKYGNKRGNQDGRRVNWSIDVNLAQEKIENLTLTDTISDNQAYIEESIQVYHAKLNSNGTVSKTELADPSTYELTVEETEFTIAWNETVERPYIVEYSTLFFAKDGENVRNDYKISGDGISEESSDASDGYNVAIRQTSGGGAEGTAGYLLVHKIDTTYGQAQQPIEGIQFELIDTSNGNVLKTVTTDESGYADFGRLLFGEYKLREVNPPKGYVGFEEQTIEIDKKFVVGESDPIDYKLEIENYKANGSIEIVKLDKEGNRLKGAEFTLYKADGTAVDTKTTNSDGEIYFEEQEPGQYYVQETKAPNGFITNDKKYEVEITETQRDAIQLEIENERKVTSVTLEKEWKDETNTQMRPDEISVNLFRNDDYLETYTIKEKEDWTLTVEGLHAEDENGEPYKYTITEQEVPGYTPSFDESGLKVTNTRAEERDITITKTWYDDDNKDGDRPKEVTVELFRSVEGDDEELVDTYTLTATDEWIFTTDMLPMFDRAGKPYNYVVKEQPVEGYESKVDGFDITNTRIGKTEVQGEKIWKDDHNVEHRPASITVHLVQNGERIDTQEITANEEGKWFYHFTDLEKYDAEGVAYNYTIVEEPVFGYQEMYWSTTPGVINIDNIRVGNTELSGTKTWVDGDNDEETRPASITVELLRNGEVVADQEVTEDNGWTYTFTSLPMYDAEGVAYEYKVQEVAVDHYEATYSGNDITNTLVGETEVSVTKAWKGEAADSVDVQLLANGDVEATATLTAAKEWTHVFTDLPKYDDNGIAIDYTVQEVEMDDYQSEVTGDIEKGFTITNTRKGKTEVTVEKVWQGSEEESATIKLLANEKEVDVATLTPESNWAHTFTNLEAFDKDGQPIDYLVEEVAIDGYDSVITGDAEEGFTITNTRTGKTDILVTKIWKDDGEEKSDRPDSVTVNLLANGVVVSEHEVTAANHWSLTISDLEKYDNAGEEIVYTITEHDVAGYESVVDGFDITNTRVDEKSITINKAWDEKNDTYRPKDIEVELFRSIEDGDKESVGTYEVTAEEDWSLTIEQLPAFNEEGKAYTYEIEEEEVAEYNSVVNGFDITNTQKTYAIGDYVWIDRNKDGIQDDNEEPLEDVVVELFDEKGEKIGETSTDENGRYMFDNLPAGKYKVKFTLTEEQEKKYKFTKPNAGDDSAVDSDADENGWTTDITLNDENEYLTKEYEDQKVEASEGIDPTWDAGVIELVDISITKQWNDQDESARPDAITVQLFANGEFVKDYEMTAEDHWTLLISGLTKYDTDGEAFDYTIKEVDVPKYRSTVEGSLEDGFNITNTQKTYAIGDYVWVDRNKDGIQDDNEEPLADVKVELYDKDGKKIAETTTDENGRYIFDELVSGDYKVKFTLTDEQAKKYKFTKQHAGDDVAVDSNADEDGWTIDISLNDENEYLTKEYEDQLFKATEGIDPTWDAGVIELVDIVGTKTWKDDNKEDRPSSITVILLANEEKVDTVEVEGPKWHFSFEGLDKYDNNGEEITYTIDELTVDGYEASIDGFDITNIRTGETSIEVNKVWKGDDESSRPDAITVDLLQNGEVLETVDITAKNDWKYHFTALDVFDSEGVAYVYTMKEHDVDGYEPSVKETKNGFEITNTFKSKEDPEVSDEENSINPGKEEEEALVQTSDDEDDDEKGTPGFGGNLPNTATTIFTVGFIGALLFLSGVAMYLGRKKKNA